MDLKKKKIGELNGKGIFIGNPNRLKRGEYFIQLLGNLPVGLYQRTISGFIPIYNQDSLNLQTKADGTYHGDPVTVTADDGYDGLSSFTYNTPLLEKKNTITITKQGDTKIEISKGYDGLDEFTVVVDLPGEE